MLCYTEFVVEIPMAVGSCFAYLCIEIPIARTMGASDSQVCSTSGSPSQGGAQLGSARIGVSRP